MRAFCVCICLRVTHIHIDTHTHGHKLNEIQAEQSQNNECVEPVDGPPTWSVGAVAFWISFQSPFFANTQNENKNRLYDNNRSNNNNNSSSFNRDFDSLLRGYRLFYVRVLLSLL